MSEIVGHEIRRLRKVNGLGLREVGRAIGLSHTYLSQIELGDRNVSPEILSKLAPVLNVSKIYLYGLAGYLGETDILNVLDENKRLREALEKITDLEVFDGKSREHYQGLAAQAFCIACKALEGDKND